MEAHVRAGLDICGAVLRYAEIEQYGSRHRLLRLGSCDFEFDLVDDVLSGDDEEKLTAAAGALEEIFSGSVAGTLHITLHPPLCYSFFAPLPATSDSSERKIRLQQEAALLAGTDHPLHITADAVRSQQLRDGARVDWVHVLAVDDRIHRRVRTLTENIPHTRRRLMVSMQGAAGALSRLPRTSQENGATYLLATGFYEDHVEFTLAHDRHWYFSQYTASIPHADAPYFAMALLDRFGLRMQDVADFFVYGNDADPNHFSELSAATGIEVSPLDPFVSLDLDSGALSSEVNPESYVGCVGVTL